MADREGWGAPSSLSSADPSDRLAAGGPTAVASRRLRNRIARRTLLPPLLLIALAAAVIPLTACLDKGGNEGVGDWTLPLVFGSRDFVLRAGDLDNGPSCAPLSELGHLVGYDGDAPERYLVYTEDRDLRIAGHTETVRLVREGPTHHGERIIGIVGLAHGEAAITEIAPAAAYALGRDWPDRPDPFIRERADRVVLVMVDALGRAVYDAASARGLAHHLSSLTYLSAGATVFPPKTVPSTAALLSGAAPRANGVLNKDDHALACDDLFDLLAGNDTLYIEGGTQYLDIPADLTVDLDGDGSVDDEIGPKLLASLDNDLIFCHLHDVDDEGHAHGVGSPEHDAAVARVDAVVGDLVAALNRSDRSTLLIVTADHGMHNGPDGLGDHGGFLASDLRTFLGWQRFGARTPRRPLTVTWAGPNGTEEAALPAEAVEALPFVDRAYTLKGSKGTVTSTFRGVPILTLLNATLPPGQTLPPAFVLTFTSSDGMRQALPSSDERLASSILAYLEDGLPLDADGSIRLIVPQRGPDDYNAQYCLKYVAAVEVAWQ